MNSNKEIYPKSVQNIQRELFLKRGIEYRVHNIDNKEYDLDDIIIIEHHVPYYSDSYHLIGVSVDHLLNSDWTCPKCSSFMMQGAMFDKLSNIIDKINEENSLDLILKTSKKLKIENTWYSFDTSIQSISTKEFIIYINLSLPNDYNRRKLKNHKLKKLNRYKKNGIIDNYFNISYFNQNKSFNKLEKYILSCVED